MDFFAGAIIGSVLTTIVYQFYRRYVIDQRIREIEVLINNEKDVRAQNYDSRSVAAINKIDISTLKERVVTLEYRLDQITEWFGSMIRHRTVDNIFNEETIAKFVEEYEKKNKKE
jgi:Tfp pilus assembly protein PilE